MSRYEETPSIAVFCDFENVAIGAQDARYENFEIQLVLERLLDKGNVVVRKAYADWERYRNARRAMHEAAFEMIEIPHVSYSGKNSADIRLVVDALDLCHHKSHLDVFVIISGDSDFSPLVSKLRENNKRVIGVGVKNSTSDLLSANCDEFIYYDDLVRERIGSRRSEAGELRSPKGEARAVKGSGRKPREVDIQESKSSDSKLADPNIAEAKTSSTKVSEPKKDVPVEERQKQALEMLLDTVEALFQDRDGVLHGSLVKQTLKRKRPFFSERFHGYRTFNDLLADAGKRGLLELQFDDKSRGYIVSAFGPSA